MKVRIILSNFAGELDRQTIETRPCMSGAKADQDGLDIIEALKAWTLAPGDSIKIEEVGSSDRQYDSNYHPEGWDQVDGND